MPSRPRPLVQYERPPHHRKRRVHEQRRKQEKQGSSGGGRLGRRQSLHLQPQWLPRGDALLFLLSSSNPFLAAVSLT